MSQHYFDAEIASLVGMKEAVLLNHLHFWIGVNRKEGRHYHDGRYWTYNTVREYEKQFPYLSRKQIRSGLNHLKDRGYLLTGNYNAMPFDRTLWYSLSDAGMALMEKSRASHKKEPAEKAEPSSAQPGARNAGMPIFRF